jgi:hypothetical protein
MNRKVRCTLYWSYDEEYSTFGTSLYTWCIKCEEETPEHQELIREITEFTMSILGERFKRNKLEPALEAIREAFPDCEIEAEYNPWINSCPL